MENELFDIPNRAQLCYQKNKGLILPEKVPYIGMGASYFAAVTLRYLGVKIFPEIANEYYSMSKILSNSKMQFLFLSRGEPLMY